MLPGAAYDEIFEKSQKGTEVWIWNLDMHQYCLRKQLQH